MGKRGDAFVHDVLGLPSAEEKALMEAQARIVTLEKERDAAFADNAALLKRCKAAADIFEWLADNDSLSDDGRTKVHAMGRSISGSKHDHPGAALLEEYQKALVRARNYSLDRVYERLGHCLADHPEALDLLASLMSEIRAMKEPE